MFKVKFPTSNVYIHLAAAGAGKTHILMQDLAEQLKTYRPDEIAFITYTRVGVAVGIHRAMQVCQEADADSLKYFRTVHSLAFLGLGYDKEVLISKQALEKFNKACGYCLTYGDNYVNPTKDDRLLELYNTTRALMLDIPRATEYDREEYVRFVKVYEAFKQSHGLKDYQDCIDEYIEKGEPFSEVKSIIIDEFQDISPAQWQVILKAFPNVKRVVCGGDDFQALYTYSGSDVDILIDMTHRYKVIKHEISYRLPIRAYELSRGIVSLLTQKVEKDYVPKVKKQGVVEWLKDRQNLIDLITLDKKVYNRCKRPEWFVLFRNNYFIAEFAEHLKQTDILFKTSKGYCLDVNTLKRIKKFIDYSMTRVSCHTDEQMENFKNRYGIDYFDGDYVNTGLIFNANDRYYYKRMIEKYGLDYLIEVGSLDTAPVLLTTIHKVKGDEAENVAVITDCTSKVDNAILTNLDTELRICYTAITRTKNSLYLIPSSSGEGVEKILRTAMLVSGGV